MRIGCRSEALDSLLASGPAGRYVPGMIKIEYCNS